MIEFSNEQRKTFDAFIQYPWHLDSVFQAGLNDMLEQMSEADPSLPSNDSETKLLKVKHFYFSRFKQQFDLQQYLEYEKQLRAAPAAQNESEQVTKFKRLENYDYEHDERYLNGLATVILGWLENENLMMTWDKIKLEQELMKAKAFYYASCVEPVNIVEYLDWYKKDKQVAQPACPFANLWQNKGAVSGNTARNNNQHAKSFVYRDKAKCTGFALSSPQDGNLLTVARLEELAQALKDAENDPDSTSRLLTATVATTNEQEPTTKSEKIQSVGLAYKETAEKVTAQDRQLNASLYKLENAYYRLADQIFQLHKPTVTVCNGLIPANTAYPMLWHGLTRVVAEHALLSLGLSLSHAPVPPLLLLSLCRAKMEEQLPEGVELYLSLAPPELCRLRAPELLKLGLADAFVPEAGLDEMLSHVKQMACCPSPKTALAIQVALSAHHTYPGPDRISVWHDEIQTTFGTAETFEELVQKLQIIDGRWANSILDHWKTLPNGLVKAIFSAIRQYNNDMDPFKLLEWERTFNAKWRQTKDYQHWTQGNITEWAAELCFQEATLPDEEDAVICEALAVQEQVAVCPVTGQSSITFGCPAAGQKSTVAKCPVTGQESITA